MQKKLRSLYTDPLYRNSIALMLNSAVSAFFGLLFWIVAARTMPVKEIGLATAAISTALLIVGLSRLGLDAGLVRYLPESKNKNGLFSTIVLVTLVLALVITSVFMLWINIFSPALSFLQEGWFLPIFFAYIVVTSINYDQNIAFISIRRADLSLIQSLLLGARIPILLLMTSIGVFGIFSSLVIVYLMTFIFGFFVLKRYGLFLSKGFDIDSIRNKMKFSLGNYTAGIFAMAPTTIIPIMILNTIGAEGNAYFYVAYSVAGLLSMIPNAVSMSLFVEGSHSLPLKESVAKSFKLITLFMVPTLMFMYFFGDRLLQLFSREYYEQSFEILQLLVVSSIFSAVTSIYLSIKKIQRDVKMINYMNIVLSVMLIGFGYVSLLKYGLLGLGYAWLGVNVVVCILVCGLAVKSERWFKS